MRSTRVTRHMRAPRSAVYRALLDPDAVQHWMVPDGMTSRVHSFEASEGVRSRISLTYDAPTTAGKSEPQMDTFHGSFVVLAPGTAVVQVVEFETADPALQGEMRISYALTHAADAGTALVGLHEGLPAGARPKDNEQGRRMSIDKLARLVKSPENGVPHCQGPNRSDDRVHRTDRKGRL